MSCFWDHNADRFRQVAIAALLGAPPAMLSTEHFELRVSRLRRERGVPHYDAQQAVSDTYDSIERQVESGSFVSFFRLPDTLLPADAAAVRDRDDLRLDLMYVRRWVEKTLAWRCGDGRRRRRWVPVPDSAHSKLPTPPEALDVCLRVSELLELRQRALDWIARQTPEDALILGGYLRGLREAEIQVLLAQTPGHVLVPGSRSISKRKQRLVERLEATDPILADYFRGACDAAREQRDD